MGNSLLRVACAAVSQRAVGAVGGAPERGRDAPPPRLPSQLAAAVLRRRAPREAAPRRAEEKNTKKKYESRRVAKTNKKKEEGKKTQDLAVSLADWLATLGVAPDARPLWELAPSFADGTLLCALTERLTATRVRNGVAKRPKTAATRRTPAPPRSEFSLTFFESG